MQVAYLTGKQYLAEWPDRTYGSKMIQSMFEDKRLGKLAEHSGLRKSRLLVFSQREELVISTVVSERSGFRPLKGAFRPVQSTS
jgi:hypothetical protein